MKDLSVGRLIFGRWTEATLIKDRKAIFFSLPKNANTSIRKAINDHNGIKTETFEEIHNVNKYRLRERVLKRLLKKGYFVFCFIRDPEARLRSAYRDIIQKKGMREEDWEIEGLDGDESFEEFKEFVDSKTEEETPYHLKSQFYLINKGLFGHIPDFVGEIENMDEDWNNLCKKLGVDWELKRLHSTK